MCSRFFEELVAQCSQVRWYGIQWLRLHASKAGGAGWVPGQGTKISHVVWCGQPKNKSKTWGAFQEDPPLSFLSECWLNHKKEAALCCFLDMRKVWRKNSWDNLTYTVWRLGRYTERYLIFALSPFILFLILILEKPE